MKSSFWPLALALLLHGCATPPPGDGGPAREVTIFYLPFDVQTYLPVTPDTIEDKAQCRFAVSRDDGLAVGLRETVAAAGPGVFDNKVVRLEATGLLETEVFVDQDGGVLLGRGGAERRLSPDDLSGLKTRLWFRRVIDGCESGAKSPTGQQSETGASHELT